MLAEQDSAADLAAKMLAVQAARQALEAESQALEAEKRVAAARLARDQVCCTLVTHIRFAC